MRQAQRPTSSLGGFHDKNRKGTEFVEHKNENHRRWERHYSGGWEYRRLSLGGSLNHQFVEEAKLVGKAREGGRSIPLSRTENGKHWPGVWEHAEELSPNGGVFLKGRG